MNLNYNWSEILKFQKRFVRVKVCGVAISPRVMTDDGHVNQCASDGNIAMVAIQDNISHVNSSDYNTYI